METLTLQRVRAIIIDKNKILIINRVKVKENYWVIPGGVVVGAGFGVL